MRKKGLLGLPAPLVLGLGIFLFLVLIFGVLVGPIGKSLFPSLHLPACLSVPQPEPSLPAEEVFSFFPSIVLPAWFNFPRFVPEHGYPIANSILGAWLSIIVLALIFWLASRRLNLIPGRLQGLAETIVGGLMGFCERVAGEKKARQFFPVVATIFLFVLFNAWLSLLPGFGSILIKNPEGIEVPLLRGANTDLNMPLALALVSFVFVEYSAFRALGVSYISKFFNFGPLIRTLGGFFKGHFDFTEIISSLVNVFVGVLELLSELIRLLSLSFRLFGNMTAGEILLLIVSFLVPFVVSDVFYVLELLIGFVQALIFSGLTLVYLTMATSSHDSGHGAEHAH